MNIMEIKTLRSRGICTIDAAMIEMRDTYNERIPYVRIPTLAGNCYHWDPFFIDNILVAYATDSLIQFSVDELEAFRHFINFEDYHSTSARVTDANGTAGGCTIPDGHNNSYVTTCQNGVFIDLNGGKTKCQPPSYEVLSEDIWKSLDSAMMALYNCQPIDDCDKDDNYFSPEACKICGKDRVVHRGVPVVFNTENVYVEGGNLKWRDQI